MQTQALSPASFPAEGLAIGVSQSRLGYFALKLGVAAAYTLLFEWAQALYFKPIWGYLQMTSDTPSSYQRAMAILMSVASILALPSQITRASQFLNWMIWIFCAVPLIMLGGYLGLPDVDFYAFSGSILVGMWLICATRWIPLLRVRQPVLPWRFTTGMLLLLAALLLIFIIQQVGGSLKFVNPLDGDAVYFHRLDETVDRTSVSYPVVFVTYLCSPLLLAIGLTSRRYWLAFAGAGMLILLFGVAANKSYALATFMMLFIYALTRINERTAGLQLAIVTAVITGVFLVLYSNDIIEHFSPWGVVQTAFLYRTVGVSFMNGGFYYDFWVTTQHPPSYLSHVNLINQVITYPYDISLGQMMGRYYFGTDHFQMNSTFWLSEGIASFRVPGLLISSMIVSIVFYMLDVLTVNQRLSLVIIVFANSAIALVNGPFFTTLLSGGLGLCSIILFFMSPIDIKAPKSA